MDEILSVTMSQIFIMFFLMALGFIFYHMRFIDDRGADQLSDLALYVANPILVAQALMRPFDMQLLIDAGWVALLTTIFLGISILLSIVLFKNKTKRFSTIKRFSVTFSNAGFIGIPLAQAIVGSDGVFFISVANTIQTILAWTYGVWLCSGDKREIAPKKIILNPAIIAMASGFFCFLFSWEPPTLVEQVLDPLGELNTGLVMLVLGAYLGQCDIKSLFCNLSSYRTCALRLLVMPLITIFILSIFPSLNQKILISMLMYEAMPVATVASLFSHKFGTKDAGDFATGVVSLSTLLSLLTLPLMIEALNLTIL